MKIVEDITQLVKDMTENKTIYLVIRDDKSEPVIELCNHECLEDRLTKYFGGEGIVKNIQVYQITYNNPPTLKLLKKNELWKKYKNYRHKLSH